MTFIYINITFNNLDCFTNDIMYLNTLFCVTRDNEGRFVKVLDSTLYVM